MSSTILATKLFVPRARHGVVPRTRLLERLTQGAGEAITLLSAPAGYGKSTLLSNWAEQIGDRLAWLSIDEADNDLQRFLRHLLAAVQSVEPGIGRTLLPEHDAVQAPTPETVLTGLINELARLPRQLLLVLDDYHLIRNARIDSTMAFLIDHRPETLRLVIATREDPDLPLSRLRARGQLNELRAADLRFAADEALQFLNRTMGLQLQAQQIEALQRRTEGWAAGLQMAALTLRGRTDPDGFIRTFTGSHSFILDYLLDEVLGDQPADLRDFLLQTSILDRLSGPLCQAVTGRTDCARLLERLERNNLFLVSLDDRREWFRFHHLFADVLRARLDQQPLAASELHARACQWFADADQPQAAIAHALQAADPQRAAELIERIWPAIRHRSDESVLRDWLARLPQDLVRSRPVLATNAAFVHLPQAPAPAEAWLDSAEEGLAAWRAGAATERGFVVSEPAQMHALPGLIAIARAYLAGTRGDLPAIEHQARLALEALPAAERIWRSAAAILLGMAGAASGDLDAACAAYEEGYREMQLAGDTSSALGSLILIADLRFAQGRLAEVRALCERGLAALDETTVAGSANLHLCLAEVQLEAGDLAGAQAQIAKARQLGENALLAEMRHQADLIEARLAVAAGRFEDGLALIESARERQLPTPAPQYRPLACWRVRLLLASRRLEPARQWARAFTPPAAEALAYLEEFAVLTWIRVRLAEPAAADETGSLPELLPWLDSIAASAGASQRRPAALESLLLRAHIRQRLNQPEAARQDLAAALELAEAGPYRQIFRDEGPALAAPLAALTGPTADTAFRRSLLAQAPDGAGPGAGLRDPLSERELAVLRQLATELSGPEIAQRLFISLNTLRTHTKNIYQKLDTNNRRATVRRAHQLGLI